MAIKVRIRKHERGLHFRHGDFKRLLAPGHYRLWSRLWTSKRDTIEVVDTLKTRFEHALLDVLVVDEAVRDALKIVQLGDAERALVWKDGRLAYFLGPGRYAFWRTPYTLHVDVYNVSDFRFAHERLETILAHPDAKRWVDGVDAGASEAVLLMRDGKIVEQLGEGRHVFWKGAGRVTWKAFELREQIADVAGQEIMTSDKVTLRVNLVVTWRITDAVMAATVVSDAAQAVYREAQLALRAAVGARTLDALLADKETVGGEVRDAVTKRAAAFGVEIRGIGLRDIILPGEMREILNRVILAEKEAQANLIRRREETAAARSEANTAKLLAENPILVRMRELEALKGILTGAKTTFVFGQQDVAAQLRGLVQGEVVKENL
jgi:regulator of protease activity HflC (stomatin/prohibitin superfamily)